MKKEHPDMPSVSKTIRFPYHVYQRLTKMRPRGEQFSQKIVEIIHQWEALTGGKGPL